MTTVMPEELLTRARAGDDRAFREMTQPHLRELQVHCYRMLGSFHDAEDAVQETLLTAWRGLGGFEGRSSLRTWLYAIATNRCLNVRRAAGRRRAREWDIPGVQPPEPTQLGEVPWLEPYPDALLDGSAREPGPEESSERTESISLAFITALQLLPPRQVAVLVLRDVLGFPAKQVADMLGGTVESVASALKRARANLRRNLPDEGARAERAASASSAETVVVAKFVRAYEAGDLDALVSLLTDDVFMSMPPMALEYVGRELVGRFCALLFAAGRRYRLIATRANGQPAFGIYVHTPDGLVASGLMTITIAGGRVAAMSRFENTVIPAFGLAPRLPA
jgi:RNA polymerase sigma-70 factor (ECF subfamily)